MAHKQPCTCEHVMTSVNAGLADEAKGFYAEKVYVGVESPERALEIKRSLNRCAKARGYSMTAQVQRAVDGTYQIRFRAITKAAGRAYMIAKYGADRKNWPYNPRRRRPGGA